MRKAGLFLAARRQQQQVVVAVVSPTSLGRMELGALRKMIEWHKNCSASRAWLSLSSCMHSSILVSFSQGLRF